MGRRSTILDLQSSSRAFLHFQHILEALEAGYVAFSVFAVNFTVFEILPASFYARHIQSVAWIKHRKVTFVAILLSFAFDVSVAFLDRLFGSVSSEVLFTIEYFSFIPK